MPARTPRSWWAASSTRANVPRPRCLPRRRAEADGDFVSSSAPVLSAQAVRAAAHAARFTLVGLAPAGPLAPEPLTEWLAAGHAAGMEWMHRRLDERLDP